MYMIDEMIEIGLKDGEEFVSEDHKIVCINLGICRPNIDDADQLQNIVTAVNKVPQDQIRKVTLQDLIRTYGLIY